MYVNLFLVLPCGIVLDRLSVLDLFPIWSFRLFSRNNEIYQDWTRENGERDLEIRYYSLSKNLCSICFKDR